MLQVAGSWVLRQASGTDVPDATSGFRAYNREAALSLIVVSKFTYTLESLIQAGKSLVAVTHVPVKTNEKTRESRLFGSMWGYVRRNTVAIFRIYAGYSPLFVFSVLAAVLFVAALFAWAPLVWDWLVHGDRSGHLQSVVLGGVLLMASVQAFALGVIADLVSAHRIISQRTLERVRRIELQLGVEPTHYLPGKVEGGPVEAPIAAPEAEAEADVDAAVPTNGNGNGAANGTNGVGAAGGAETPDVINLSGQPKP